MSEFRFEKIRVPAELTLASGEVVAGTFFVAGFAPGHDGPERVGDLLNDRPGFFPFQGADGRTVLYNRGQVVMAALIGRDGEATADPGFQVAKKLNVTMVLSTGGRLSGTVPVYRPRGRERLSDYAQTPETFRYLLTAGGELLVNAAHVVELRESEEA
jgi:hypothetical protein